MVKKPPTSALTSANRALREHRWEDAVRLYGAARREVPELGKHIDFNLKYVSRSLQGDEENPILVAASDSPPSAKQLPKCDVLVTVLARTLPRAGQTARLLSRRADYRICIVILLTGPGCESTTPFLTSVLRATTAKYVLITAEDMFPGRDWLRWAYEGLSKHAVEAIYANTGLESEAPKWRDVLAPPALLHKVVQGGQLAEGKAGVEPNFLLANIVSPPEPGSRLPESLQGLHLLHTDELAEDGAPQFTREVCVVMPCLDEAAGKRTAQQLLKRAGMSADVVVAVDTRRQGFIPTLNQVARRSSARYIVYLAEDARPGERWLLTAHQRLQGSKKNLLAFNCGKWHGRVAAFGMVHKKWAYDLYGDQILYEGYRSHRADNEITAIARARGTFLYAPECVLAEYDVRKDFRKSERQAANFQRADARLFRERFRQGFDGLADPRALAALEKEYLDVATFYNNRPKLSIS